MDHHSIQKNVAKHINLTRVEFDFFNALLQEKPVSKGTLIVEEGQACRFINYVHQGAFRAFTHDHDGNESIIMFAINDWWITDIHGFVNQKPAMMNVQAMENSVIFQLHHVDLQKLYKEIPKFERFFRILMENAYIREQLRIRQNLTTPAEDRYKQFLLKYPQFIQRIPLKQVASYLGVTPQFLSVIRRRLRKGN